MAGPIYVNPDGFIFERQEKSATKSMIVFLPVFIAITLAHSNVNAEPSADVVFHKGRLVDTSYFTIVKTFNGLRYGT